MKFFATWRRGRGQSDPGSRSTGADVDVGAGMDEETISCGGRGAPAASNMNGESHRKGESGTPGACRGICEGRRQRSRVMDWLFSRSASCAALREELDWHERQSGCLVDAYQELQGMRERVRELEAELGWWHRSATVDLGTILDLGARVKDLRRVVVRLQNRERMYVERVGRLEEELSVAERNIHTLQRALTVAETRLEGGVPGRG